MRKKLEGKKYKRYRDIEIKERNKIEIRDIKEI
jgi:hypothetical protein